MARRKYPATYDDLRRVPDTMVAEIIDGELIATPRPASPHAYATSRHRRRADRHPSPRQSRDGSLAATIVRLIAAGRRGLYPRGMAVARGQLRAFRARWALVNAAERRTLRRMSMQERLRRLATLMSSAAAVGGTARLRAEDVEVRRRWARLRRAAGV
jgi:hypothetical protein